MQAELRGKRPEVLAGQMLTAMLVPEPAERRPMEAVVDESGVFHGERLERVLASIAADSSAGAPLPAEALTREALYRDHD